MKSGIFNPWKSMDTGLLHSHSGLAYIIFIAALVNLVLALTKSNNGKGIAGVMKILHMVILMCGRVSIFIGIVMWFRRFSEVSFLNMWWAWSAILLWAPIEILAKRMVAPDLSYMKDGGQSSKNLVIGTGIQLVLVAVIFGMMHAK
jgi:hypothetical protein